MEPMPPDCRHHYIVESPTGQPKLRGECKLCGGVKFFPNHIPETPGELKAVHDARKKAGK